MLESLKKQFGDGWALVAIAAAALLAYDVGLLWGAARQGAWLLGPNGLPGVRDVVVFWSAGKLAAEGHAAAAYDWVALRRVLEVGQRGAFVHATFPLFYPPFLMFLLAPLGRLNFLMAATVWIVGGMIAYLAVAGLIVRRGVGALIAAAAPASLYVVCVGQTGFLSAALLGGALALTPRRPVLAGALIGMLAYKPQLGLLIPIALIAGGQWRSFWAAVVTLGALVLASGVVFGWPAWAAFIQALAPSAHSVGAIGVLPSAKLQSVYGLLLWVGADPRLALAIQAVVSLAMAGLIAFIWRGQGAFALKAAALIASLLLASPYSCIYDLTLLVIAVLFVARDADGAPLALGQGLCLTLAYIIPLAFLNRPAPLGPLCCVFILGVVGLRLWRGRGRSPQGALIDLTRDGLSAPA
jgi:hypothetical protein